MMRRTGFHFRFNHRLRDKLPGIEGRAHRDLGRVRNRVASAVVGVLAVPPARVT